MAKKQPAPQPPSGTPEIEMFKDDGEPGSVKQSIGLVFHNASIIEHKEGSLTPAMRLTTEQARQFITKMFALIVEIDSDPE